MFSLPEGDQPLLATETVAVFAELAEACERVFAVLGDAARTETAPEAKHACARASRICGEYAARWSALVPESVLLDAARHRAAARAALASVPASVLIERLLAVADPLDARLSVVSDGAARRLLLAFQPDLERVAADLRTRRS